MSSGFELEVTLTSAKDLKNVNWRYGPTRPYAVVWVDPDRKATTRVDEDDTDSPDWNENFVLPLTHPIDQDTTLYIDVVHANRDGEDTKPLIGSAKLRLHEIVDEAGGYGAAPVSKKLKLKRPSGRPQGKNLIEAVVHDRRYGYGAPPPGQYDMRGYGDAPPPGQYGYNAYSAPPPQYNQYGSGPPQYYGNNEEQKKSGGMGMGTGLAIGAAAGLAGGVALAVGYDALTDEIAEDAAEKVDEGDYDDEE